MARRAAMGEPVVVAEGTGRLALPDPPRLAGVFRQSLFDFYYNSWRLVPANLIWGALLIAILVAAELWLPLLGLAGLLGVPVAGLHRMAAMLVRTGNTSFADFRFGIRRHLWSALAVGFGSVMLAVVFGANVLIGFQFGGPAGWLFGALALYAEIGSAMMLVAFWPILVDPLREDLPLRRRLSLAALVVVARPGRIFALTFLIGVVLVVSTVLFAALLTVSVAYVSLVATRYVLPAADRLEGRATVARPE